MYPYFKKTGPRDGFLLISTENNFPGLVMDFKLFSEKKCSTEKCSSWAARRASIQHSSTNSRYECNHLTLLINYGSDDFLSFSDLHVDICATARQEIN